MANATVTDGGGSSHTGSQCPAYDSFKIKAADMITSNARELATELEFSPQSVETDVNPGLALINKMEEGNSISHIDKLMNAITKLHLSDLDLRIREEYSKFIKDMHEKYPSFSYRTLTLNLLREKTILTVLHQVATEDYKRMIPNYSLTSDHEIGCSNNTEDINIILLGKTGVGKSSTANSIHGTMVFGKSSSAKSVTQSSSSSTCTYKGRKITILDTPGVHSNTHTKSEVVQELARKAFLLRGGVHCFIICLNAADSRYTKDTVEMLKTIKKDGGKDFLKYCIVVYTKAETELNKCSLDIFLRDQKTNPENKRFLEDIGDLVVAVNNSTDLHAEQQRNRDVIIAMIDKVIDKNRIGTKANPFTDKAFQKAEELHERVAELVRTNKFPDVMVNAVIEAIVLSFSIDIVSKDTFVKRVIQIMSKSKIGTVNKNPEEVIFMTDGDSIHIPLITCKEHIELIFLDIKGDMIILKKNLTRCASYAIPLACVGIFAAAIMPAYMIASVATGISVEEAGTAGAFIGVLFTYMRW